LVWGDFAMEEKDQRFQLVSWRPTQDETANWQLIAIRDKPVVRGAGGGTTPPMPIRYCAPELSFKDQITGNPEIHSTPILHIKVGWLEAVGPSA